MRATSTKAEVIEMIRRMPDEVTVNEIVAALRVRQKVDTGLRQLDAGPGIEHEEVTKRLARVWPGEGTPPGMD